MLQSAVVDVFRGKEKIGKKLAQLIEKQDLQIGN